MLKIELDSPEWLEFRSKKIKSEYESRESDEWKYYSQELKEILEKKKDLEQQEIYYKNKLIELANDQNCRGNDLVVCRIIRKGSVNYSKIPELKDVDLEKFRNPDIISWRFNIE